MRIVVFVCGVFLVACAAEAGSLRFSGYEWEVRERGTGGPGPNHWSDANAWVDAADRLHLRISRRDGKWFCPEVVTKKSFGFGVYRFVVEGPVDRLDRNVVLGLFDYPDDAPDGTHEIDIEFARWGRASHPIGNYTVWPATPDTRSSSHTFEFRLPGAVSIHTFTRSAARVSFVSRTPRVAVPLGRWTFAPKDSARGISRKAMPVHINLWLFEGLPPADGRDVELVIRSFRFRTE